MVPWYRALVRRLAVLATGMSFLGAAGATMSPVSAQSDVAILKGLPIGSIDAQIGSRPVTFDVLTLITTEGPMPMAVWHRPPAPGTAPPPSNAGDDPYAARLLIIGIEVPEGRDPGDARLALSLDIRVPGRNGDPTSVGDIELSGQDIRLWERTSIESLATRHEASVEILAIAELPDGLAVEGAFSIGEETNQGLSGLFALTQVDVRDSEADPVPLRGLRALGLWTERTKNR